jgi:aminomethyltransferase
LPPAADTLRRTPLFERHQRAGARLVPFAGWEMPVQYEGIRQEHVAVRTRSGVFDVSHMGEIETSGPQAEAFLQRILSNDVSRIAERGAQYSVLCREDGGVLDDLFTYRLGDGRFLTVTNASNHDRDFAWFRDHAGDFDVDVSDAHERWAMLAARRSSGSPTASCPLGCGRRSCGWPGRSAWSAARATRARTASRS